MFSTLLNKGFPSKTTETILTSRGEKKTELGSCFSMDFDDFLFTCELEDFEREVSFGFREDSTHGLGLKHLIVELGWHARIATVAANRHFSAMDIYFPSEKNNQEQELIFVIKFWQINC